MITRVGPGTLRRRGLKRILIYVKQLIVEIDDATAARLERVAPSRARQRSQFVRDALRNALDRALEAQTAAAYLSQPDAGEDYFDAAEWAPQPATRRKRSR
jgi:predicted transcriptional regulator